MKFRPLLLFVRLPVAALLGSALGLPAAEPSAPEVASALHNWLGDLPGGVAAAWIATDGVTFHQAGRYSATDRRPITADTLFEIGSITKVFTALLLADAAREHRLALDAPVGPPFAPSAITYEALATHRSGLPRLPVGFTSIDASNPYREHELATLIEAFDRASAAARPAASSYSNFGFAALGQAVAGAWGEPYAPLLKRRVLVPLGLTDTLTDWREADPARLAPGHGDKVPAANWDLGAYAPAGSLVSSTRDLSKFIQACLASDSALPLRAALTETLRARPSGEAPSAKIGLAWQIARRGASTVNWHNGGTGGYRSFIGFCPETGRGVVLLTNTSRALETLGFSLLPDKSPAAAPVISPRPAATATKPSVAPAPELLAYLGDYPLSPTFVIAITATGNELFLQATGQGRLRLSRMRPDLYAVDKVKAQISFERDSAGRIVALVLDQNGARQRAARLPATRE